MAGKVDKCIMEYLHTVLFLGFLICCSGVDGEHPYIMLVAAVVFLALDAMVQMRIRKKEEL